MAQHVDLKKLTPAEQIVGEDAEETALLREMLQDATDYLWAFRWCPPIDRIYLGYGVGAAVAVFLFHFGERIQGTGEWLWVVTGDLPTACFVIDQAPDPASAPEVYCQLMEDRAKAVLEGRSYELEPCKGQVRFFRTFFRPNSASSSPRPLRPVCEGARGKRGFHFSDSPTADGLRSHSYVSRKRHIELPTEESSYSHWRRPAHRRQFIPQDTLGVRPAMESVLLDRLVLRGRYGLWFFFFFARDQLFVEQLARLEHRTHDR
jgi:hypothetical protein